MIFGFWVVNSSLEIEYGSGYRSWELRHFLFPLTLITIGDHILADPTEEELILRQNAITMIVDENFELAYINKVGGTSQGVKKLEAFCNVAMQRAEQLKKILNTLE